MRALLDTCVLFDIIARRMSFEESLQLLLPHAFGDLELWVSAKSYTDIFNIMRKSSDSKDIQRAFLESLNQFKVCSVEGASLQEAAKRCWPDFEDCLISVCAENIGADFIITRDAKGFAKSRVSAIAPGDVMGRLKEQGLRYAETAI